VLLARRENALHIEAMLCEKPRIGLTCFRRLAGLANLGCACCGSSSVRKSRSRFVFMTERAAPISTAGYRKMIARTGESAEFPFPVHPHMLRHACGYKLANDGQDTRAVQHYLGHRNIQHTVRYTELSPERFKGTSNNDDFFVGLIAGAAGR
jgi:integrase